LLLIVVVLQADRHRLIGDVDDDIGERAETCSDDGRRAGYLLLCAAVLVAYFLMVYIIYRISHQGFPDVQPASHAGLQ